MFRETAPTLGVCVFVLIAMASVVTSSAQSAAVAGKEPPKIPGILTSNYVKTGLYFISGGGGNSVLRLSGNGLLLVDGKLAVNYDELRLRVKRISSQAIVMVVNTDHFEDHTGTNARFLADQTPVLAQQNEKQILAAYNPSSGKIAPPSNTFGHDQTLHLGPVQVQLLHFGNARTSADTVVYFPDLKAVALGDLYSASPDPDFSAGGSLVGWGPVLDEVLKLDFNVAVPGKGPTVSRSEVESFKTRIDTLVSRAVRLVKSGVTKDQLMAQLKTDDLGWKLNFSAEQVDSFFAELSRSK
jgi:glyoxylase-like metal-dependent hydrolase (beta-lactamase superfamily II)